MVNSKTWVPTEQITHTLLNAQLRDKLNDAYGAPCMELQQTVTYAAAMATEKIARPVGFNVKYFDGGWDGSVMLAAGAGPWNFITIARPGTYLLLAQMSWAASNAGKNRYLAAYIDEQIAAGGVLPDASRILYQVAKANPNTVVPQSVSLELEYQLGAGNTLQLGFWQDSGGTLNITPGADRCFWQMFRAAD